MDTLFGLAFALFWLWVIVAGFRAVGRRIFGFLGGSFSGWETSFDTSQPSRFAQLALPADPEPIWTASEQRGFGRKLATNQPISADAIVAEMERELSRMLTNASEVEGNVARFQKDLAAIDGMRDEWTERAGVAIEKGRDMLAKSALQERQKLDARASDMRADLSRLEEVLAGYRRDVAALEAKLDDSRRRALIASSRLKSADDSVRARDLVHGERTAAALAGLDQVERTADLREGQAEALALGNNRGLAAEIAALQADDALDRELAALKQSRTNKAA